MCVLILYISLSIKISNQMNCHSNLQYIYDSIIKKDMLRICNPVQVKNTINFACYAKAVAKNIYPACIFA